MCMSNDTLKGRESSLPSDKPVLDCQEVTRQHEAMMGATTYLFLVNIYAVSAHHIQAFREVTLTATIGNVLDIVPITSQFRAAWETFRFRAGLTRDVGFILALLRLSIRDN